MLGQGFDSPRLHYRLMKHNINIYCKSGLSNRIRYLFSWLHKIKKEDNKSAIKMIWPINNYCTGTFDNFFEPIDCVSFIYDKKFCNIHHDCSQSKYSFVDKNYTPQNIKNFYSQLNLNSRTENTFKKFNSQNNIKKYNSIHIRRTDHSILAKKNREYTDDIIFENFVRNSSLPVYLATDNQATQSYFIKKYNNVFIYKDIKKGNCSLRQTTLEHTIIDIWMCIYSNQFMPSGYSSLSGLIMDKRKEINA
jgi:hypothetical protein